MKGFTRKLDELGRICLPVELRKNYNINREVEIIPTDKGILLRDAEVKADTNIAHALELIDIEMKKVKESNPSVYAGLAIARKAIRGEL